MRYQQDNGGAISDQEHSLSAVVPSSAICGAVINEWGQMWQIIVLE